jgi:hypothetical protein
MWKITGVVLLIVFLLADSIYIYLRLKKYWRKASWAGSGKKSGKWRLGLSSLNIPLGEQTDTDRHRPKKT